jgi:hypothetical protein
VGQLLPLPRLTPKQKRYYVTTREQERERNSLNSLGFYDDK